MAPYSLCFPRTLAQSPATQEGSYSRSIETLSHIRDMARTQCNLTCRVVMYVAQSILDLWRHPCWRVEGLTPSAFHLAHRVANGAQPPGRLQRSSFSQSTPSRDKELRLPSRGYCIVLKGSLALANESPAGRLGASRVLRRSDWPRGLVSVAALLDVPDKGASLHGRPDPCGCPEPQGIDQRRPQTAFLTTRDVAAAHGRPWFETLPCAAGRWRGPRLWLLLYLETVRLHALPRCRCEAYKAGPLTGLRFSSRSSSHSISSNEYSLFPYFLVCLFPLCQNFPLS